MRGQLIVKCARAARRIEHAAKNPVGKVTDDRGRKGRGRHHAIPVWRVAGRNERRLLRARGGFHRFPDPKHRQHPQQRLDPAGQIPLQRMDRWPRTPDPDRECALTQARGAPPLGQSRASVTLLRPRPAQFERRQHPRKRANAAAARLKIAKGREADARCHGNGGLGEAELSAAGADGEGGWCQTMFL